MEEEREIEEKRKLSTTNYHKRPIDDKHIVISQAWIVKIVSGDGRIMSVKDDYWIGVAISIEIETCYSSSPLIEI